MSRTRLMCHACNKSGYEGEIICPTCHKDLLAVVALYNMILRERWHLRSLTMPELFSRMYAKSEKRK
jgi:hypothetical protein